MCAWLYTAAHVADGNLGILLMSICQSMVMCRKQASAMHSTCWDILVLLQLAEHLPLAATPEHDGMITQALRLIT